MKKIISILLAVTITAALFSGCSPQTDATAPQATATQTEAPAEDDVQPTRVRLFLAK